MKTCYKKNNKIIKIKKYCKIILEKEPNHQIYLEIVIILIIRIELLVQCNIVGLGIFPLNQYILYKKQNNKIYRS